MRVLITGIVGFAGSYLTAELLDAGYEVCGTQLPGENRERLRGMLKHISISKLDLRDSSATGRLIRRIKPDIVFHLAAQSLVRRSYRDPLDNWSTNVMGTANVLDACRDIESVNAIVAITTDKVYADQELQRGYSENDNLGGHDPYSASKAACELLIDSYRKAFFNGNSLFLASARAGNVIGGGDWSEDRLFPDLVRSVSQDEPLVIRSPLATRPCSARTSNV